MLYRTECLTLTLTLYNVVPERINLSLMYWQYTLTPTPTLKPTFIRNHIHTDRV